MGLTGQLSERVFEREGWDSMARTADHSSLAPSLIMEKGRVHPGYFPEEPEVKVRRAIKAQNQKGNRSQEASNQPRIKRPEL